MLSRSVLASFKAFMLTRKARERYHTLVATVHFANVALHQIEVLSILTIGSRSGTRYPKIIRPSF